MMDLAPVSTRQREVIILANPMAGSRRRVDHVEELVDALRAQGLDASPCWDRDELTGLVQSRGDRLRCVVAAGGDGTLNEVLNRAPGTPVAILPLGTENLAARYFRLVCSPASLARTIASATVHRFDLARARGRFFSLMAGVGFDARVVHDVHRRRRGHISHLGYVFPALRALWHYSFPVIEVEVGETGERLRGAMVFLFNLPVYGGRLPIGHMARPDDGWLDLLVFQRPGLIHLARYAAAVVCRRHQRLGDVQHRQVKGARLWSSRPVPVQLDGDPAGTLPLDVEVVPGALPLLLPG
jgi:diacylglycerol kinase family enzyme